MADRSPKGTKNMGGGGLISKSRNWDEGAPKDFTGQIHPHEGKVGQIPDATDMKQTGHGAPSASIGGASGIPVKNTQSARAPKGKNPAYGHTSGSDKGYDYHACGKQVGADKGPRGSGRSGGAGVTG